MSDLPSPLDLSQAARAVPGLQVVRPAPFVTLGFASYPHPGMLAFAKGARFAAALAQLPGLAAVLTTESLASLIPPGLGLATASDPEETFVALHNHLARTGFYRQDQPNRIDPSARIHPGAVLATKNLEIGPRVEIGPGATLAEGTRIGEGVVVHPGATLGAEGFQLVRRGDRVLEYAHGGGLAIGPGAVIHAGAVIARGLFRQDTVIGPEARIGNLAFVSHNTRIGTASFVGHGAVVNGNVQVGARVWIGPNATVANNLVIGDDAFVAIGAVIVAPVRPGERVLGGGATQDLARTPTI